MAGYTELVTPSTAIEYWGFEKPGERGVSIFSQRAARSTEVVIGRESASKAFSRNAITGGQNFWRIQCDIP